MDKCNMCGDLTYIYQNIELDIDVGYDFTGRTIEFNLCPTCMDILLIDITSMFFIEPIIS